MKKLLLAAAATLAISGSAWAADVVVIVSKDNDVPIGKELVTSFYLGEAKMWPGARPLVLLDQPAESPQRVAFDKDYLGKSVRQVKDLWTQLATAGKATPPREVPSDEDVKKAVSQNRYAIGYISAKSVDDTVKVVGKE
jgi:ABC-type phosphate transport system substrate-binding protein